jgi:hypothetical protein
LIIFSEKDQYNNLIKNGFKRFVNVCDLSILARQYSLQGNSREQIQQKLITFSKKWSPEFNEFKNEGKILQALDNITKNAILSNNISFSQLELDKILDLKIYHLQKLIFILMCLAKKDGREYIYLNTEGIYKLSEIFELADIKLNKATQEYYLYLLQQSGAIFCNLKPLLKYDLLWCDSSSPKVLEFEPSNDMISKFDVYIGKKFICKKCGRLIVAKRKGLAYCSDCKR